MTLAIGKPDTHKKKPGAVVHTCNPSAGEEEAELWTWLASLSNQVAEPQVQ